MTEMNKVYACDSESTSSNREDKCACDTHSRNGLGLQENCATDAMGTQSKGGKLFLPEREKRKLRMFQRKNNL